jgi:hypothetical protein
MLALKTEKLEGRVEAMADFRKAIEERLSGLNQEIGELRSSIMERDRAVRDVQAGFSRIEEMAEGMEPEKIASQLARKDETIERNQAAIEGLSLKAKQLRADVKANSDILENIKDIKNVIRVVRTLKQKVGKVEDDRRFTSRTAGKIETMFSDLGDKLGEFQSYKEKIAFNEETMHEIMKTVDTFEARLEGTVKKDDLGKLKDSVDTRFEKTVTEMDDKIYDVRKLLESLLDALREGGIKGVLESASKSRLEERFATKNDLDEIRTRLEALRNAARKVVSEKQREFAGEMPRPSGEIPRAPARVAPAGAEKEEGPIAGIKDRVDSLIGQADEAIKAGSMDDARSHYREAVSLFNQLSGAESYDEAVLVFERMNRLYRRLRLYS